MGIRFSKMHGLGNDFVVIDAVNQKVNFTLSQIQQLADRHRGIGFDQLLLLEPKRNQNADFFYRIFNADGSESFQCGNGARCIARFIVDKKLSPKKHLLVETKANVHDLIIEDDSMISVNMQAPEFTPARIPFIAAEQTDTYTFKTEVGEFNAHVLSMGNPHCVLTLPEIENADVAKIGKLLCHHTLFPSQANVEFMQIVNPEQIQLRVYERGVGETQACGSGACAAVVAGRLQNKLSDTVTVVMPGGELMISWDGPNQSVWMTGDAVTVFEGEL